MQMAEPYKEQSMLFQNKGELVIVYYLANVLKDVRANKDMNPFETIKHTQEILPQFFECNLALASVYGVSSPLKAKDEYRNAIKYARDPREKLRASLLYTDFLIRSNEYLVAIDFLNALQLEFSDCMDIHFEKAKALGCVNQFEEALAELDQIERIGNIDRLINKVIS
jgi:tetratricopeptide (TPR) repeat protein